MVRALPAFVIVFNRGETGGTFDLTLIRWMDPTRLLDMEQPLASTHVARSIVATASTLHVFVERSMIQELLLRMYILGYICMQFLKRRSKRCIFAKDTIEKFES